MPDFGIREIPPRLCNWVQIKSFSSLFSGLTARTHYRLKSLPQATPSLAYGRCLPGGVCKLTASPAKLRGGSLAGLAVHLGAPRRERRGSPPPPGSSRSLSAGRHRATRCQADSAGLDPKRGKFSRRLAVFGLSALPSKPQVRARKPEYALTVTRDIATPEWFLALGQCQPNLFSHIHLLPG